MRNVILAAACLLVALPARAEVVATGDAGFVVRHAVEVTAGPDERWEELVKPTRWWSGKHTYSGDAANLSLDALAGGCFCEVLLSEVSPRAAPRGSVEHMRVVNAEQPRVLRLSGALGPLQSEAVQGTLTVVLKPVDGGTRIMWEYVVGGYMRFPAAQMAPLVDVVIGEQLSRLAAKLGAKTPPAKPTAPPPAPPPPPNAPGEGR